MRHGFVTEPHRQHFVEAGEGEVVVLLHGWPQTWYCWRHVIPLLAHDFRVIAPDLRGLGETVDPMGGYEKREVATDVRRLLEQLGVERYHLVGHDWGGVVAWSLATNWPEGVATLTIVDVAIPGDGSPDISQGGRRWHHAFHQTAGLPETLVTGREAEYLGWFYDHYGATHAAINEEERAEYLRSYRDPARLSAGFGYYRALPTDMDHISERAREYRPAVPVLAVGGATSFGRRDEVERSLRRMADDVTGIVVADAGHWVPEEQPRVLSDALRLHIRRAGAARGGQPPP